MIWNIGVGVIMGGEGGVWCVDVLCLVQLRDSLVPGEESCAPRSDGEFFPFLSSSAKGFKVVSNQYSAK